MVKTDHETLVIDESSTTDDGYGWRRLDKVKTAGSVVIRVNNLLVGTISAGGWIRADGLISAGKCIRASGSISAGGWISAGESILCRVLYWGMLALPQCKEIVVTHAVRPPEWQREYWADRLGVEMPESDCYDEIERRYASSLPEWLARTDLLPVERLILESHTPEARTKAEARAKELQDAIKREGNK